MLVFYEHSGIDGRGTLRAIFSLERAVEQSTLTQQFAKQLLHGEGSKFYLLESYKNTRMDSRHPSGRTIYKKMKSSPCTATYMILETILSE
jgi:membrane peptidoglycan carboxypeptidase